VVGRDGANASTIFEFHFPSTFLIFLIEKRKRGNCGTEDLGI